MTVAGMAAVILGMTTVGPAYADQARFPAVQSTAGAASSDTTSTLEKARVDRVPTPKLAWYPCYQIAECATAQLPLDYDQPNGATTEIALLRIKARNPKKRIGSLFVNPGGPSGQGTGAALSLQSVLSDDMLDRFDLVGFDPRGVGFSDQVRCFGSFKDQSLATAGMEVPFPWGAGEQRSYLASAKNLGTGCSTTGKPLSGSMSTAEVARDMDVLRRAVGDRKLTYLGFSYGTALGQYYANMFPDRLRAIVVDGVVNPQSWVGTDQTADQILDDRLRSADGAYQALHEMLLRCGKAGPDSCQFAQFGDPVEQFAALAGRLQAKPVVIGRDKVTYADLISGIEAAMYDPSGYLDVDAELTELYQDSAPAGTIPPAQVAAAQRALSTRISARRANVRKTTFRTEGRKAFGRNFSYSNDQDAFSVVTCTDARHPRRAESWPAQTAAADRRAPYFGRLWDWESVQCAGDNWSVHDEDAYTGPFNRHTRVPVLFVGDYYDPATNYDQAVSASQLLPNSRLLSSDSWGHTAYGTSNCVTSAVDSYLIAGTLPAAGTVCHGDLQPFADTPTPASARRLRASADAATAVQTRRIGGAKQLPPVVDGLPPSILLGTR